MNPQVALVVSAEGVQKRGTETVIALLGHRSDQLGAGYAKEVFDKGFAAVGWHCSGATTHANRPDGG